MHQLIVLVKRWSIGSERNDPFSGVFFLKNCRALAADRAGHCAGALFAWELNVADGAFELGRSEERLLGRFASGEAVGAKVIAVFVLSVADVRDIDAADKAKLAQAGGDGDERAAIVALALAAEMLFGDLGRLAAAGTANAEGHVNSVRRTTNTIHFRREFG